MKLRTWIYHAQHEAKIVEVTPTELKDYQADGWKLEPVEKESKIETNDEERDTLLDMFNYDPTELNKDELVKLGRYLGIKMMKAWPPATLIKKVQAGLE